MKRVEITNRLNRHYGRDALRRTQMHDWIKMVKSGRKYLSNSQPLGKALDK
jgi:hypothetical protein